MTRYKVYFNQEQGSDIEKDMLAEKMEENDTWGKIAKILGINKERITELLTDGYLNTGGSIHINIIKGTSLELTDNIRRQTPYNQREKRIRKINSPL